MTTELRLSRAEIDSLADDIAETAAHLDAATHRLLRLIRDFDRAGGWHTQGALSCAHWLSWRIGLGLGPAREKVRVAHALADLPRIDAALASGELSYSKARAMTRVATEASEEILLLMARKMTAAQLERTCRLRRQVQALDGTPRQIETERRWVVSRPTDDGMISIQLRLLPDEAARVLAAIERCAGDGPLADGAVAMAEVALAAPADAAVRPPVEAVVHISAATLEGRTASGDGLAAETCRRLLCDGGVVPALEDDAARLIDVGRKTRTIPAPLRRALDLRDRGCRFPGCTNVRFVDAHHLAHWIDGGETSLDNTLQLCRTHHRHVHEYGFTVEKAGDDFVFRDQNGAVISRPPPAPWRPDRGIDALRTSRPGISAETNAPGWDGLPIDYGLCIDALAR